MKIVDQLESMVKHVKEIQHPTTIKPEPIKNPLPGTIQQPSVKR